MKKRYKVLVLVGVLVMSGWVGWYFAIATPQQSLQIGEVPVNQPDDQKALHIVKVGDVTFNMPAYYTEMGGGDGSWAKLRNVYNGECLRKVDGECFSSKDNYLYFNVYLEVPDPSLPLQEQIRKENARFVNDCETAEVNAAKLEVPLEKVKYGVTCPVWAEYHGLILKMIFRTGYFPRRKIGPILDHVTTFLDKFRISPQG